MNDLPPMQTPQQQQQQQYRKQPQYQQSHQQKVYYQPPPQQNSRQPSYQYAPEYYNYQQTPQQQIHQAQIHHSQPPISHSHSQPQVHTQPIQPQVHPQFYSPPSQYQPVKKPPPESKKELTSKQKLEIELRNVFDKVDVNRTGKISPKELSFALLNFDHTRFQDSTIKLMINLFCTDSKSLNFEQFVSLWKYLSAYKKLFIQADVNKSGDISFGEFQKILEQIGYKLDIDLVLHLFQKYSLKDEGGVGRLKFDSFIELL
ncbi:unnamed protein product [Candida verbasci]|uniref:EF-hand domain-containing protein n=1 Tax=Candida verbasci TaxID=1227364 RepID=A0A9W4XAF5_9ASCO|nr:unnamed protein product [Candida verbasci]